MWKNGLRKWTRDATRRRSKTLLILESVNFVPGMELDLAEKYNGDKQADQCS